jgi:hypothetical protein
MPGWQHGRNLLVVIGLTGLAVSTSPILNRLVHDWLICQQVERVLQAPDDRVEESIHQLAGFGLPAIDDLVAIAVSVRAVAAAAARDVVNERVTTWLIQSREFLPREPADSQSTFISLRLSRLAEALVRHIDSMDIAGRRWAQRLTLQVLLHADRIPPEQSVQVLANCQTVLAAVPPHRSRFRDSKLPAQAAPRDPLQASLARPTMDWNLLATVPQTDPRPLGQLEKGRSSEPGRVLSPNTTRSASPKHQKSLSLSQFSPLEDATHWRNFHSRNQAPSSQEPGPAEALLVDNPARELAKPSKVTSNPLRGPTQTTIPMPSDTLESDQSTASPLATNRSSTSAKYVLDVPTPREMAARRELLQAMPLRDLIVRLGRTHEFEAALIRTVARVRGLSDAELALAPWLASSQEAKRMELLQHLSQLPARKMRRWLRWLMEDADGEVRLRALTMMATTGDPQLEALARRRVMEDPDPRVVSLATRIIEGATRR